MSDPTPDHLPALAIRACRPDDAEAVCALRNQPGVRYGTLSLPYATPESVRAFLERRGAAGLYLLAFAADRLAGAGSVDAYAGRRAHAAGIGLMVADDFVGRGVGTALLSELVWAADRWLGLRRLELKVNADNVPAIRLYRRAGFVLEGTLRGDVFRDGAYIDSYAMARLRP